MFKECQFPIAVLRNFHKLRGLKQHKLITLHFWRSQGPNGFHQAKVKVSAGLFLLEAKG